MAPYDIYKVGINNKGSVASGTVEKQKSEVEEIITRINNKIDSLYDVLRIVYLDISKPEVANEASSPLINKLQDTEHKITQLLDGIRI